MKQIFGVHKYIIIIILFIAHFMMNVIDLFMNNNNGMPVNYFHGILLLISSGMYTGNLKFDFKNNC